MLSWGLLESSVARITRVNNASRKTIVIMPVVKKQNKYGYESNSRKIVNVHFRGDWVGFRSLTIVLSTDFALVETSFIRIPCMKCGPTLVQNQNDLMVPKGGPTCPNDVGTLFWDTLLIVCGQNWSRVDQRFCRAHSCGPALGHFCWHWSTLVRTMIKVLGSPDRAWVKCGAT